MTVPVSGEDQPDPRVELLAEEISDGYRSWSWADEGSVYDRSRANWRKHATEVLHRLDAADRAAGIRRVTEDTAAADRVRAWCEFHRANYNGAPAERLSSSYRDAPLLLADLESLVAAPVPVQEDR